MMMVHEMNIYVWQSAMHRLWCALNWTLFHLYASNSFQFMTSILFYFPFFFIHLPLSMRAIVEHEKIGFHSLYMCVHPFTPVKKAHHTSEKIFFKNAFKQVLSHSLLCSVLIHSKDGLLNSFTIFDILSFIFVCFVQCELNALLIYHFTEWWYDGSILLRAPRVMCDSVLFKHFIRSSTYLIEFSSMYA